MLLENFLNIFINNNDNEKKIKFFQHFYFLLLRFGKFAKIFIRHSFPFRWIGSVDDVCGNDFFVVPFFPSVCKICLFLYVYDTWVTVFISNTLEANVFFHFINETRYANEKKNTFTTPIYTYQALHTVALLIVVNEFLIKFKICFAVRLCLASYFFFLSLSIHYVFSAYISYINTCYVLSTY